MSVDSVHGPAAANAPRLVSTLEVRSGSRTRGRALATWWRRLLGGGTTIPAPAPVFSFDAVADLVGAVEWDAVIDHAARLVVPALGPLCAIDTLDGEGRWFRRAVAADRDRTLQVRERYPLTRDVEVSPKGGARILGPSDDLLRSLGFDRELLALLGAPPTGVAIAPLQAGEAALGTMTILRTAADPAFDDGARDQVGVAGRLAALALTHARRHFDANEELRRRDELVSIAAHELRDPIHVLQLQLDQLDRGARSQRPACEQVDEGIRQMSRQLARLRSMTDRLLDVSLVGAGRVALELEELELAEVVREAVERMAMDDAGSPELRLWAPLPVAGRWDRLRIEQVVTNLLTNAIKYGDGRPIEVAVETRGAHAVLRVTDRGIGIPADRLHRIFESYERAAPSSYEGVGLGLYITRQIVAAHGGVIYATSQLGQGSTFTVELPLATPPKPTVQPTP